MSARSPITVFCSKCGQEALIYPGQTLIHAKCPNKVRGQQPPVYVKKEKP